MSLLALLSLKPLHRFFESDTGSLAKVNQIIAAFAEGIKR
jgi:hypothetical protein